MTTINLKADKREITGRKVKNLRKQNLIPANVYGKKTKSFAIQLTSDDFKKAYDQAGETGLIELSVDKDKHHVLISNTQIHPVTQEVLHIDLREVDLKEKIAASVPLEVVGEAPAEKTGLGTLVVQLDEIEFEALPTDFPEKIEVDVSALTEVDQAIFVKDLKYDKSKLTTEQSEDDIVVKIEPPQEEKIEEPAPVEGEEGAEAPAEGEQAPAEGETPAAEGEAKPENQ